MRQKIFSGGLILFFILTAFYQTVNAEDIVFNRTDSIRITNPDGNVSTVMAGESLPDIPSGATIEILGGSMDVAIAEGFVQVVAGNSVATVKAGDWITVFIEQGTAMADFRVNAGEIDVAAGNTTVLLRANQHVQVGLNKTTGVAEVIGVRGIIETVTACVKSSVSERAAARISADAETRTVYVSSQSGEIKVTAIDGKIKTAPEGATINTPGCAMGEIATFPAKTREISIREEPAEPERTEASPFRP